MPDGRARILLIAPTALDRRGAPIKERRLHLPALTLPALAAVTPPDAHVRLVYETVESVPYDQHWDLVGLTGMGSGIVRAWQISDRFRNRGVTTVIGGIAASIADASYSLKHADAVVQGEAEEVWPEVVRDAQAGRLQRVYRAPRRTPIDAIPVPRYELMNRYRMGLWRPVQATRGCPFTCSFCSVTAFNGGSYRTRPVDQVIRDVRAAKRHGTSHIAFVDDNIGVDFDYCAELWGALIPERVTWMSQCSLHLAERPELLRLAHRSGCRLVSIGIESTNPDSLAAIHKEWNRPDRYAEAIGAFRAHGIEVSTEMIVGLDSDDMSVFDRTAEFILNTRISIPRVHIITPVPGTPLFADLEAQGRILTRDFSRYTGGNAVFRPKRLDPEMLQTHYWQLYERLFSWRSILRRALPNPARLNLYMRAVVWAANLRYRGHVRAGISPGIL
jgi:radical SAM superfamily enzyme YgiQ (UPF0313 family)